jgi:hypothetical protein
MGNILNCWTRFIGWTQQFCNSPPQFTINCASACCQAEIVEVQVESQVESQLETSIEHSTLQRKRAHTI